MSSLVVDDLPPDQLLADDTASDLESDEILNIKEEDFDEIPFLQGIKRAFIRVKTAWGHNKLFGTFFASIN